MFRIILLLSLVTLFSCTNNKQGGNAHFDSLIQVYRDKNIKDATPLKNSDESQAIKNVFEALEYQKQYDSINPASTSLFLKSVDLVDKRPNIGLRAWVYSEVGFYYYTYSHYLDAAPYFIKLSKIIDDQSEQVDIQQCDVILKTAYFFETMQNYGKSKEYYTILLSLCEEPGDKRAAVMWALGYSYLQTDQVNKAKDCFENASKLALGVGDTLRYAKSQGSLAKVYSLKGDLASAEQHFLQDISLSKQLNQERNLMYAQIQLGRFYFDTQRYQAAEKLWEQAYAYAKTKAYLIGYEREIALCLLELQREYHQNDQQELYYRREIERIDYFIKEKESKEVIQKINWETTYQSISWELEAEKNISERTRYQRLFFMSSTILLLILVVVIYFSYKRIIKLQAFKYQAKLLAFQLDKLSSENKLKQTHASLASYQVYLTEKTQQIVQLEKELQHVKSSSTKFLKEQRPNLEQLLNAHLMTDENWNMFKGLFKEEQTEYYLYLTTHFPDLTESNLRIILLQRLGLTNQETANLLGITIDAVKKAKQRLKKKYEDSYDTIFCKS
ncbi:tetratricopeptide repeat protein [Myroides pelagicus]|uniref:Tetratricopeptide repeat protein n=1 Tax=Myroides pelagicus TaxID=270914 RepID=A0A7K1GHF1_9FLAO|nr:tetratricopeptide repeat protein [Myroides pelagicus]MTH28435.1 tetratricopeptide repeat protein [Myroides pelagicus]